MGLSPDFALRFLLGFFVCLFLLPQSLSERKKKSLVERRQAEEEAEELRRSHQDELEKLRQLLKKSRTSTDQAASEQVRKGGRLETPRTAEEIRETVALPGLKESKRGRWPTSQDG